MRRSFTLLEILIAVAILSMLFLAMSYILGQAKSVQKLLERSSRYGVKKNILVKVLYNDLLQAQSIRIEKSPEKNYCRVFIRTANSLYDIIEPYVVWYVSKNQKSLMRAESYNPIALPNDELFYLDRFAKNVQVFRIYQKGEKLFVYIDEGTPLYFEMVGPSVQDVHTKHRQ